ncbi:Protein M3 [Leucoagaricus gongylophorus]
MSISAGTLIWISIRPLIRLAAGVASGFIITKADIFPPIAARGAGQVALNITLPSLLFSKLVTAFTKDNIKAFGPLVFVAVLYEALGVLLAWIIKQFFWVPHRFRYGILVAGGWGNVGDVSTAVLLSLTGNAPFQGTQDQNLAVAYISVFILVFTITLFPCGTHRVLAWDFVGPDEEPEAVQAKIKARRRRILHFFLFKGLDKEHDPSPPIDRDGTVRLDEEKAIHREHTVMSSQSPGSVHDDGTTVVVQDATKPLQHTPRYAEVCSAPCPSTQTSPSRYRRLTKHARGFMKGFLNPISITICLCLPISLVPQLKALFVQVPNVHMPPAPDGQPPLAFIQDIATFIGAASIPIGLICLGSSLARLNVPLNQWRTLPVGAILWMTIGKLIIIPVIGVLICKGLIQSGVIFKDDKVLVFISMFFSCLPTATTQVYLTQVYNKTGSAEHIAAFLVPQYILM